MTINIGSIGLGTWRNTYPGRCEQSIATAIDMGYTHVDTARAYGNESYVGEALRCSSVPRSDVTVATKVHPENLGYDDVYESVDRSLSELGIGTIDLLYVHWPALTYDPDETWEAFDDLWKDDRIEAAGVSNFTPDLVDEAMEIAEVPIVANQVEMHPLFQQHDLVEHAQERGISLVAFSPIARSRVFEFDQLIDIAGSHDASVAQVSLAWLHAMDGVVPIPMADIEIHQRENYESLDLKLDDEEIETIESMSLQRRIVSPEYAPWRE
ncbi:aldo/keto reductase [Halococcus agarilyticus]|uniref:aldo/keto reductase n=1 Tax=Halococcus agarilyticus TaxID=1232219 RepID=UPI00067823BF|nr:aldo/keto reductase [Halococcus agarilyticus]